MPISPSPWTVQPYDRMYVQVTAAPTSSGLSDVVALVNGPDRDANAALICLAPTLAALIRMADWAGCTALVANLDAGAP